MTILGNGDREAELRIYQMSPSLRSERDMYIVLITCPRKLSFMYVTVYCAQSRASECSVHM